MKWRCFVKARVLHHLQKYKLDNEEIALFAKMSLSLLIYMAFAIEGTQVSLGLG